VGHHERPVRSGARAAQRHHQVHPARCDFLRAVEAFVAHHLEGAGFAGRPEQSLLRQRLQERLHLALQLAPDDPVGGCEQGPASSGEDAVHQHQAPALHGQQSALGRLRGTAGERPERPAARPRRAQRLQRVHPVRGEALALGVREHELRSRPLAQQQFLVGARVPRRVLRVEAQEGSRDRAAVGEGFGTAPKPVERDDAREAHQRVLGAEVEFAQSAHDVVAGLPRGRRVDDQHRAVLAAQARRHHQRAGTQVAVAGQGRDAHEVEVFDRGQREQPRPGPGRPDQVIVGQRAAVVAVRIRVDVADRVAGTRPEGLVRPRVGNGAPDPHQARLLQRRRHVPRGARNDGQAAEDLLVLDALRAARADALHDQVEPVGLVPADVVVVDRRPQHLPRARAQRRQRQRLAATGQGERRRRAPVHDPHHDRVAAAVLEELLDGVGERARLPEPAEDGVELGEASDRDWPVDRPAQRATHEGGDGRGLPLDGVVGARRLCHDDAIGRRFPQSDSPKDGLS